MLLEEWLLTTGHQAFAIRWNCAFSIFFSTIFGGFFNVSLLLFCKVQLFFVLEFFLLLLDAAIEARLIYILISLLEPDTIFNEFLYFLELSQRCNFASLRMSLLDHFVYLANLDLQLAVHLV